MLAEGRRQVLESGHIMKMVEMVRIKRMKLLTLPKSSNKKSN